MADSLTVLTTPLGKQPLVCRMKTFDALSQPFRYELELVSPGSAPVERDTPREIHPGDLLGKTIAVHLRGRDVAKTVRHFHGHVVEFQTEYLDPTEPRTRPLYRVVLRPWLWLLGLRTNCRVFKDRSVVDIFKKICEEHGFNALIVDKRRQSPAPLEYVVQYNESDLAFVSRLLEREGIYYYFVHSESKHELVLADDPTSHTLQTENAEYPAWYNEVDEYRKITIWHTTNKLRPMQYRLDDYDFVAPTTELEVKLKANQHVYEMGKQFEYPGGYKKESVGLEYVKYVLEAQNAPAAYVSGEAKAIALASGQTFTATVSPGHEYLITRTEGDFFFDSYAQQVAAPLEQKFDSAGIAPDVTFKFTAVDKQVPFRPERLTPKPVIAGLQTARVVGSDSNAPEGSIHIDEHGRVMVKFHWLGPAAKGEGAAVERSCWVRVAQAWAGNAWGAQFTPRVGSEVVVCFEEGDPDRPLIVGSVYNGLWQAPFTQSDGAVDGTINGVRTDRAVNGGASEAEPNVLKLDDAKGKILMKSEEVGVKAIKNANIEGDTVGLAGGFGGQSKIDVGGMAQAITLSCPMTLTLQTPRAQIELGPRGIVILGNLMVNNAIYPLPPTPAQLAAAVAELGVDFTKDMAMDTALGGGVDDDEPAPGAEKAPEGAMFEDEAVADLE